MRLKNSLKFNKNIAIAAISNVIIVVMLFTLCFVTVGDNEGKTVIGSSKVIYRGNTTRNEISLMINVYWGDEYLDSMLKTLEKHQAKCTFFVGGCWADDNNEMLNRIISEGHELGNHGYFHKDHKGMSIKSNLDEIKPNNAIIKSICNYDMKLFAPPSGSYDDNTVSACESLNMKVIMWTRDTVDWRDKDEEIIYKRAVNKAQAGDLILMHPTEMTAKALDRILTEFDNLGLKAVTVSQIITTDI